jgi:hypothetical protein
MLYAHFDYERQIGEAFATEEAERAEASRRCASAANTCGCAQQTVTQRAASISRAVAKSLRLYSNSTWAKPGFAVERLEQIFAPIDKTSRARPPTPLSSKRVKRS